MQMAGVRLSRTSGVRLSRASVEWCSDVLENVAQVEAELDSSVICACIVSIKCNVVSDAAKVVLPSPS